MRFFAIGQEAEGFIAIGQQATGVIALGQVATGVIAIGQLARGVIAIGQLAFGVASIGMVSFGLVYAVGFGAAGRRGKGLVLPLVPVPRERPLLPERKSLAAIIASRTQGWLSATIQLRSDGEPEFVHEGAPLRAPIPSALRGALMTHVRLRGRAFALVEPQPDGSVKLLRVLDDPQSGPAFSIGLALIQIPLLFVLAYLYWEIVLMPLGDFLVTCARDIFAGRIE